MNDSQTVIFPRSPRETMCGWMHLPRFIDKIRLRAAGRLGSEYIENFGKGFDALWLEASGVQIENFVGFVSSTICDGQVADWVRTNVKKSDPQMKEFHQQLLSRGNQNDEQRARLALRKEQSGFAARADITCFVDYIDADEGRS